MSNEVAESNADQDLGSGGELILPDLTDSTGTVRHLIVGAGKDGNIYLVNRDSMGKFSASGNNIWQQVGGAVPGGIFSTPAYFNGTLYYGDISATLKALASLHALLTLNINQLRLSSTPIELLAVGARISAIKEGFVYMEARLDHFES